MYDVIAIGTATRDIFLTSPLFKVVRDLKHLKKLGFPTGEAQCFALGGKIEVGKPITTTGGGATNAALTFSRQGLKTACLSKIGKDEAGEVILKELKREKISSFVVRGNSIETSHSTILLAPSGEQTILVYRGTSEKLNAKEIPFPKLKARWFYISPGRVSFEVVKKIINFAAKNKIKVAFSPSDYFIRMGQRKLKPLMLKSRVVVMNREEAALLTGIDYDKEKEIFRKLDKITPGIVIITDGSRGALVSDGKRIYKAGVFKTKLIDTTGAGDAFGSGFVAGLIRREEECEKGLCRIDNIEYAIRLGMANAASVIEHIGAKEGILRKPDFVKSKRWQRLPIQIQITNLRHNLKSKV
jgi:sugar/nucleoside kinase (ribokinase family)